MINCGSVLGPQLCADMTFNVNIVAKDHMFSSSCLPVGACVCCPGESCQIKELKACNLTIRTALERRCVCNWEEEKCGSVRTLATQCHRPTGAVRPPGDQHSNVKIAFLFTKGHPPPSHPSPYKPHCAEDCSSQATGVLFGARTRLSFVFSNSRLTEEKR